MFRPISLAILAAMTTVPLLPGTSLAADQPVAADVWKIEIGQPVTAIPDGFADFACGSNGGPPALTLTGFADFMQCPAEPTGWHEVYFRYDDEFEYWARANNLDLQIAASGTKVYGLPVIMSVLVDDDGVVEGLRLVSDPRDSSVRREEARFLEPFLLSRFRPKDGDWACIDLPAAEGETPVNGVFLKQDCTLSRDGMDYALEARYLRGAGQRQVDLHTGQFTEGQFDSTVRFEMHLT